MCQPAAINLSPPQRLSLLHAKEVEYSLASVSGNSITIYPRQGSAQRRHTYGLLGIHSSLHRSYHDHLSL
eukprot:571478-Prorocentrum_minimum.AAC.2